MRVLIVILGAFLATLLAGRLTTHIAGLFFDVPKGTDAASTYNGSNAIMIAVPSTFIVALVILSVILFRKAA